VLESLSQVLPTGHAVDEGIVGDGKGLIPEWQHSVAVTSTRGRHCLLLHPSSRIPLLTAAGGVLSRGAAVDTCCAGGSINEVVGRAHWGVKRVW